MALTEYKWLWLGLACMVVVAAIVFWMVAGGEPFTLVVLFEDIGDLERGDPVVWKNFTVGKVVSIQPLIDNQIGVTIRLKEEYVPGITHGTEFTLKRASLFGLVGKNAIEVVTPTSPGAPFSRGEKVQGKATPKISLVEEGKQWTREKWSRLKEETSLLVEEFQSSPYRREIDDALRELGTLAEKGAQQAKEGLEQFRKDHEKDFEAAIKKLERIRDEMRKRGDESGARRIDKQIEGIRGGESK